MANTRFKGANSSERLTLQTLSDSDMFQTRHLPGTVNDADKGVSKSLMQALPVAVCATAAATAAKVMTLAPESCPDFVLVNGRVIHVYFSAANTASTPTANVAGTGAIPIVYPSGDFVGNWAAGTTMDLMYISITVDNTAIERWVVVSSLPVDTVAANNMNSVTSNAVAAKFDTSFVAYTVSSSNINWTMIKIPTGNYIGIGWNKSQLTDSGILCVVPSGYTLKEIINGDAFMENNSNNVRRAIHKSNGNIYMYIENGTYKAGSIRVQALFSKNS